MLPGLFSARSCCIILSPIPKGNGPAVIPLVYRWIPLFQQTTEAGLFFLLKCSHQRSRQKPQQKAVFIGCISFKASPPRKKSLLSPLPACLSCQSSSFTPNFQGVLELCPSLSIFQRTAALSPPDLFCSINDVTVCFQTSLVVISSLPSTPIPLFLLTFKVSRCR